MGNKISFTVKVDEEIHQKLKLAALVKGESMSALLTSWVQNMEVNVPDSLITGKKPVQKRKLDPIVKKKPASSGEAEIQKTILQYQSEKMSLQKIADTLNADNISTLSGKGKWYKSTVSNLIKKWENKKSEKK